VIHDTQRFELAHLWAAPRNGSAGTGGRGEPAETDTTGFGDRRRTPRQRIGIGLLAVGALVTAFVAQFLFTGEAFTRMRDSNTWVWTTRHTIATLLVILAVALTAVVTRLYDAGAGPAFAASRLGGRAVGWSASLGAGFTAFGIALFLRQGETAVVHLLWIGALVSFVTPLLLSRDSVEPERWRPWESLSVLGLTALGLFLRVYRLTELPEHIDSDVALMGVQTRRMMERLDGRWFGQAPSEHLFSTHQVKALFMWLFGPDHFGLVMMSVVAGTLTLPVLYALGRDAFGPRVALIATALLTTSYTHIHFSRILFGPTATFLLTLSFLLLFRAFRTGRAFFWGSGGLTMGLSLLTYDSSRVGPVILVSLAAGCALWDPTGFRAQLRGWGLFLLGVFVGFGPMTGFVLGDFSRFKGRGHSMMIWSPGVLQHSMEKYEVSSTAAVLLEQAKSTFLTLHMFGDNSPHFALPRPMVGALAAALFVLGLGLSLARLRRAPHFLVLAWVALTFVLGGVLTSDPPYWPHLNIALPAICLIGALGADQLVRALAPVLPAGRTLVPALLAIALLASGAHNWAVYSRFASDNADDRIESSRFLEDFPRETFVFLVADEMTLAEDSFRFHNRGLRGKNVSVEELLASPRPLAAGRPFTVIVYGHEDSIPRLQRRFPGTPVEPHLDRNGNLQFHVLSVIPPGFHPKPRRTPARPGIPLLAVAAVAATGWVLRDLIRGDRPVAAPT